MLTFLKEQLDKLLGRNKDNPDKKPASKCLNKKKLPSANIISVEFLDGSDTNELKSTGYQYVNLPSDKKWADGKIIKNTDRLRDRPRFLVKFDKPGIHVFTYKIVPGGKNTEYTQSEKKRNIKFCFTDVPYMSCTNKEGKAILNTANSINASGNDDYTLEAKDINGKIVKSSAKITTRRLFYFIKMKMTGLNNVAPNMNTLKSEFLKNYIRLEELPSVSMKYFENISTENEDSFESEAKKAFNTSEGKKKLPFSVAVAYTDHLAVINPNQKVIKSNVKTGPNQKPVVVKIQGPGLKDPSVKIRMLWHNIVKGQSWYVTCIFKMSGKVPLIFFIPKEKCTMSPEKPNGSSSQVSVSVDHLPAGTGTIILTVNWVDRMRAGLSFDPGNLICVCTRCWWDPITAKEQNDVLIHEMGHKVGLVTEGTGSSPDKSPTFYNDAKGHVGTHCYSGNPHGQARYDSDNDWNRSNCVMYGATNNKSAFCSNCKISLKKMDISRGWST